MLKKITKRNGSEDLKAVWPWYMRCPVFWIYLANLAAACPFSTHWSMCSGPEAQCWVEHDGFFQLEDGCSSWVRCSLARTSKYV